MVLSSISIRRLIPILKYNINIEPHNFNNFFKSKKPTNNNSDSFLQSIKNIDDIFFDKSIAMFHDLNDLIIIFLDKSTKTIDGRLLEKHNTTKRVYINHNINNVNNSNNINSITNNKKTRRNLFKDIL